MILTKYRMLNISDNGYVETLSLEEAEAYVGTYVIIEEEIIEDDIS
jgi:hypothetical protein